MPLKHRLTVSKVVPGAGSNSRHGSPRSGAGEYFNLRYGICMCVFELRMCGYQCSYTVAFKCAVVQVAVR